METAQARRPLKSRDTGWARATSQFLVRVGATPNAISIASLVFAAGAAVAIYLTAYASPGLRMILLLLGAAGIQLRLLCNLLDGMVAVEGGLKSKSGEVYNDLPDRIADLLIMVAAGYAVRALPWGVPLGWSAALLAVFTAYVRMLGGAVGLPQSFIGPMAKQQRMGLLTAACLLSILETRFLVAGRILWTALIIVVLGCLVTIARRTRRIVRGLEAR